MYKIEINKQVVAVSDDLVKAMNSVQMLVANFIGVKNENFVEYNGILYKPWSNMAEAKCCYENEVYDVAITRIATL